jgi:hypothetical protein
MKPAPVQHGDSRESVVETAPVSSIFSAEPALLDCSEEQHDVQLIGSTHEYLYEPEAHWFLRIIVAPLILVLQVCLFVFNSLVRCYLGFALCATLHFKYCAFLSAVMYVEAVAVASSAFALTEHFATLVCVPLRSLCYTAVSGLLLRVYR